MMKHFSAAICTDPNNDQLSQASAFDGNMYSICQESTALHNPIKLKLTSKTVYIILKVM